MDIRKQVQNIQNSAVNDPRFKKNEEVVITQEAVNYVEKLFNSLLPHFPAWRQSCPTDEDLGRLKSAWTKAIMRNSNKTGKQLNVQAGLLACEESETDWLPSVGKFIKMCDQSNQVLPLAQRALDLFNSAQKQIDSVGQMVVSKHAFGLKQMKAAETNKQFIELYLSYAENNPIEGLEAFALTETVQLSEEHLKAKQKRTQDAQSKCLSHLNGLFGKSEPKPVEQPKKKASGVSKGSTGIKAQTQKQADENRDKQLKAMGLK
jgi:hypothetical protein